MNNLLCLIENPIRSGDLIFLFHFTHMLVVPGNLATHTNKEENEQNDSNIPSPVCICCCTHNLPSSADIQSVNGRKYGQYLALQDQVGVSGMK